MQPLLLVNGIFSYLITRLYVRLHHTISYNRTMNKRCLRRRLWGAPRNTEPATASGHDHRTCTPHNTLVLYAPVERGVCAGQYISVPGLQSFLYKWLPIRKLLQPGTYAGPYCTKAHDTFESNHCGGPRSRPKPMSGHPPIVRLSPRCTGILTQHPYDRILVACLMGAHRHPQHGPSAH